MDDKYKDYHSLTQEEWWGLLHTLAAKDNRTRAEAQIKILPTHMFVMDYDSGMSLRFPCKNNYRTGILASHKPKNNNTPKHKGTLFYCMMFKKAEIPECRYKSNISWN